MKTLFGVLIFILFAGRIQAEELPAVVRISADNPIEVRMVFSGSRWPQFESTVRNGLQKFSDVRIVSEGADFDAVFLLTEITNSGPSLYSASILVVTPLGNEGLTNLLGPWVPVEVAGRKGRVKTSALLEDFKAAVEIKYHGVDLLTPVDLHQKIKGLVANFDALIFTAARRRADQAVELRNSQKLQPLKKQ